MNFYCINTFNKKLKSFQDLQKLFVLSNRQGAIQGIEWSFFKVLVGYDDADSEHKTLVVYKIVNLLLSKV